MQLRTPRGFNVVLPKKRVGMGGWGFEFSAMDQMYIRTKYVNQSFGPVTNLSISGCLGMYDVACFRNLKNTLDKRDELK